MLNYIGLVAMRWERGLVANSGTLKLGEKSKDSYSLQFCNVPGRETLEAENKNEMVS